MAEQPTMNQDEIIKALRETSKRPWTRELAFKQKVSGIMGGMPADCTMTREQVEAFVRERDGETDHDPV